MRYPLGMSDNIESHLVENRIFNPPAEFAAKAKVGSLEAYRERYDASIADPEGFWAGMASELSWQKKWDTVLEWDCPFAKWFVGGEINVSENCVDRHLDERGDKIAILWEGGPAISGR